MDTTGGFTAEDYKHRMRRAMAAAAEQGLAGVLVTPGPDLVHLCGYAPPAATERLTLLVLRAVRSADSAGGSTSSVMSADSAGRSTSSGGEPTMVVPRLEQPDAERATGAPAITFAGWVDGIDPYRVAADLLDPGGRYAIADGAWAAHLLGLQRALPGTSYVSLTEGLPMLRAVKDEAELARLAAAGAAADATYGEILGVTFAGRRETEVAADLAALLRKHGHSQVDFTIVGSGPNGANPHHEAGERVIVEGEPVVLDFGGLRDGYGSDTTRTVHVGQPSDEVRAVHEVVRRAQQAAFEAVRPGVSCQEIDRVARQVITEAGYGEYFIHRVGHGIGVTTHEPPYLVEGETQPLVPGMCFSIEPGIYLPGRFGVRIEDIVTVTEDGGRRLNNTPRDLQIVH